jgi:hypothetical protein
MDRVRISHHISSSWVVTADTCHGIVAIFELYASGQIIIDGGLLELLSGVEAMDEGVLKLLVPENAKEPKASIISIENLLGSVYIHHGRYSRYVQSYGRGDPISPKVFTLMEFNESDMARSDYLRDGYRVGVAEIESDIQVNEDNKQEYVRLAVRGSIRASLDAFLEGLYR